MEDLQSISDGSADFFIACHVIEHVQHVPNVIVAIRTVMKRLKLGGTLLLVLPNKSTIFDNGRPTTSLEHFITNDAFL